MEKADVASDSERPPNSGDVSDSELKSTVRATVPELEALLYREIPILDHGFIRVIDYMGDDAAVVQAARVSYGKGTKTKRDDQGLINYLMRNSHTSPFEMCELKIHVKLPIFVARQWVRHRTASINEYSARYSVLDREFYIPAAEDIAGQATTNAQGRGETLTLEEADAVQSILREDALTAHAHYEYLLNEGEGGKPIDPGRTGLARELARINLSLNFYTQWYWKIDLHNLLHFLALRGDVHAQYEIRQYAVALRDIVRVWVPMCYAADKRYRIDALRLTEEEVEAVRGLLAGGNPDEIRTSVSPIAWRRIRETFLAPESPDA